MPSRKNGDGLYRHWYNFIVSDESLRKFSVETLPLGSLTLVKEITLGETNGDTEVRPYVVDVYFESPSAETPSTILRFMKRFDGVDIYELIRRGEATVLQ